MGRLLFWGEVLDLLENETGMGRRLTPAERGGIPVASRISSDHLGNLGLQRLLHDLPHGELQRLGSGVTIGDPWVNRSSSFWLVRTDPREARSSARGASTVAWGAVTANGGVPWLAEIRRRSLP